MASSIDGKDSTKFAGAATVAYRSVVFAVIAVAARMGSCSVEEMRLDQRMLVRLAVGSAAGTILAVVGTLCQTQDFLSALAAFDSDSEAGQMGLSLSGTAVAGAVELAGIAVAVVVADLVETVALQRLAEPEIEPEAAPEERKGCKHFQRLAGQSAAVRATRMDLCLNFAERIPSGIAAVVVQTSIQAVMPWAVDSCPETQISQLSLAQVPLTALVVAEHCWNRLRWVFQSP